MVSRAFRIALLAFLGPCAWGAASIVMSTCVLSSDGLTITCAMGGVSGSLSPGSGITGFTLFDTQNSSGRTVNVGSITSSGTTLTLTTFTNSIDGSVEPLNNSADDLVQITLATVGGGSNLTDSGGNTPTGQSSFTITTNSSTWYAAGGSTALASSRIQGGIVTAAVYQQEGQWNSADGFYEFGGTCTAIDIVPFLFNSRWILQQDGTDIHDWGVNSAVTHYAPQGLVSGLSGAHIYRIIQIDNLNVPPAPSPATLLRSIRCVGSLGTRPAARLIIAANGDSITVPAGSDATTDDRYSHFWGSTEAIGGSVIQHSGSSGQQVCGGGGIAADAASRVSNLGGTPLLALLQGGNNDHTAGTSAGTFRGCWDTLLTNTNGVGSPPTTIISFGILPCCVSGNIDYSAYNAQIAASCAAVGNCTYVDTGLWLAFNAGKQSDGIHLSFGAPFCTDFTKGENVFCNRFIPITAAAALGSSYTLSGPSTGTVGSPSTNFTVTLQGGAQFVLDSDSVGRQTITCADGSQGGTFTPSVGSPGTSTVDITQTTGSTFTFTYNAASTGAKTISCTPKAVSGTQGWVAPANLTYTAGSSVSVGQSINIIDTGNVANAAIPAVSTSTGKCRIDFAVHDFSTSFSADIITDNHCGPVHVQFIVYPPGTCAPHADPCNALEIYNAAYDRSTGFPVAGCPGVGGFLGELWPFATVGGHTIAYVRYQNDFATHIDSMETWDGNGVIRQTGHTNQCTWPNLSGTMPSNGAIFGNTAAPGDAYKLGFVHVYSDNVPLGSRMPTFAEPKTNCIGYYQFNTATGNLTDTCPAGPYNLSAVGVAPLYTDTPTAIQALVLAVPQNNDHPGWSNWYSLHVGASNTLSCTDSVSMSEASDTVSCLWSHVSGPTTPSYSSFSATKPTFTNLAWGTYDEHLVVTDTASATANADLIVGAVQCDANGVVVTGSANADLIWGPMMCFGQNPYHYKEMVHWQTVQAQRTFITSVQPIFEQWQTPGAGTIAYHFTGIGPSPGTGGTTLSSTCNATDVTCAITDAAQLPGLASLPTWLLIGGSFGGAQELVRVTGTTATSGPATITFGYDGRGLPPLMSLTGSLEPLTGPSTWGIGTVVGESRISGTSTQFVSDASANVCPAGAPGPPGAVVYSTGTVTITAAGNTVTGSGTTFTAGMVGDSILISATHGGGTPFNTWASITAFTDTTHITTNHTWPVGVDGSAFTFKIVSPRYISLEFTDPTGVTQRAMQSTFGCESETKAFFWPSHDVPGVNGTSISGLQYGVQDTVGINSQFTLQFYGGGAFNRAFCYYSGYCHLADNTGPLDLSDRVDDNNAGSPENGGGYLGGTPLYFGGGAYGSTIKAALSPGTWAKWDNITGWESASFLATQGCDSYDSRDGSILAIPQMMGALMDTNSMRKAASVVAAGNLLTREQGCARADFSFAHNSEYYNVVGNTPPITLTQGSATGMMTSGNVPSNYCFGIATVTITVTHNSGAFTGTGIVTGDSMIINGTINSGTTYTPYFAFTHSGTTSGVLAALWPGDSGTFTAVIQSGTQTPTAFYRSAADDLAKEAWACTVASSTTITLNRTWDGPTHTDYLNAQNPARPEPGYHQQVFMLGGWKADELRFGSYLAGSTGTGYQALVTGAANWLMNTGADPNTRGMNYVRDFGAYPTNPNGAVTGGCEPNTTQSGPVITRAPSCDQGVPLPGSVAGSIDAARVLNAEAGLMLQEAYRISPSPSLATFIESFVYGPVWGDPTLTDPGHYTDESFVNENGGMAFTGGTCNLSTCKYPNFYFAHNAGQWPAIAAGAPVVTGGPSVQYHGGVSIRGGVR